MNRRLWTELCGYGRLAAAAVVGVAAAAESLHATISRIAPPLGRTRATRTRGLTGLVYGSIRGITRLVDRGLDLASTPSRGEPLVRAATPSGEAWRAVVNGVFGDRLAAAGNPLAITMRLRRGGTPLTLTRTALAQSLPQARGRILVLVHGLCRNDLQWREAGHDHGAALERDHGYTAVYLHYNSGQPVARNGEQLAALLGSLCRAWPVPVQDLTLMGHSMGGLVIRSAVAVGQRGAQPWLRQLRRLVFLGTPHRGARWERLGKGVESALRLSPYAAPFADLGAARSAGITDLRHGDASPLPAGIECLVIAATLGQRARPLQDPWLGDGLVPLDSALGPAPSPGRRTRPDRTHRWIARGTSHLGLLAGGAVHARLVEWLAAAEGEALIAAPAGARSSSRSPRAAAPGVASLDGRVRAESRQCRPRTQRPDLNRPPRRRPGLRSRATRA